MLHIRGEEYCKSVSNVCHVNHFAVFQYFYGIDNENDISDCYVVVECSDDGCQSSDIVNVSIGKQVIIGKKPVKSL